MQISEIVKDIGLIVSMVIGLGGLFYTWTQAKKIAIKTEVEGANIVVDSMGEAIRIAKDAAVEVKNVRAEMRLMQNNHINEIELLKKSYSLELKTVILKLDDALYKLEVSNCEKEGIKDWAERLVSQINSIDKTIIPVSMNKLKLPKKKEIYDGNCD